MPSKTNKAGRAKPGGQEGGRAAKSSKSAKRPKAARSEGASQPSASSGIGFGDFAGPLIGDLIAGALLAGADALTGQSGKGKRTGDEGSEQGQEEPARAPLEGEVEPARAGAAGVGMADLAGYAMAIAVSEIASRFAASYERQMGNGPVVRQTANGARMAADVAWKAFDKKEG
jgi:hypothetical protein